MPPPRWQQITRAQDLSLFISLHFTAIVLPLEVLAIFISNEALRPERIKNGRQYD